MWCTHGHVHKYPYLTSWDLQLIMSRNSHADNLEHSSYIKTGMCKNSVMQKMS